MKNLIKALVILNKYLQKDVEYPTFCDSEILYITAEIDPRKVSKGDLYELYELGFEHGYDSNIGEYCFWSTKYGNF